MLRRSESTESTKNSETSKLQQTWTQTVLAALCCILLVLLALAVSYIIYGEKTRQCVVHSDELKPIAMPEILKSESIDEGTCERVVADRDYAEIIGKKRHGFKDSFFNDSVSCDELRSRGYYYEQPLSPSEAAFPIAYARIVYMDYHFQEMLFNVMYAPQNYFCYIVDSKASEEFHSKIKNLGKCFDNVIVSEDEFPVDSSGHNMLRSFLNCLRLLLQKPDWKYAITLQNHDVPIKTNREIVEILTELGGANDMEMDFPKPSYAPKDGPWTFKELQLYRDSKLNDDRIFRISKGYVEGSYSREFIEFLLKKLDTTTYTNRLEKLRYALDEFLFASVNLEDKLEAPGGFTRKCLTGKPAAYVSRFNIWDPLPCPTHHLRHDTCVFGLEALNDLDSKCKMFANKFYPEFDFDGVLCWTQRLFKLTHGFAQRSLDLEYVRELPHVRFNKDVRKWRANLDAFPCDFKFQP